MDKKTSYTHYMIQIEHKTLIISCFVWKSPVNFQLHLKSISHVRANYSLPVDPCAVRTHSSELGQCIRSLLPEKFQLQDRKVPVRSFKVFWTDVKKQDCFLSPQEIKTNKGIQKSHFPDPELGSLQLKVKKGRPSIQFSYSLLSFERFL